MEPEIPAFIREERRRKVRASLHTTLQKYFRIAFALIIFAFCIALAVIMYLGYEQLASRTEIVYIRQIEVDHTFVNATVTAYTSSVDETDEDPFITASGRTVRQGTLACPSKYKFGTVVEINGTEYTCEDRMNKRYRQTERFDMWVESKELAYEWGKQQLQVKVYKNN